MNVKVGKFLNCIIHFCFLCVAIYQKGKKSRGNPLIQSRTHTHSPGDRFLFFCCQLPLCLLNRHPFHWSLIKRRKKEKTLRVSCYLFIFRLKVDWFAQVRKKGEQTSKILHTKICHFRFSRHKHTKKIISRSNPHWIHYSENVFS